MEPDKDTEEKKEDVGVAVIVGKRTDWVERIMRSLFQLMSAGLLTQLFDLLIHDIPQNFKPYVALTTTAIIVAIQNYAEEKSWVRPLLKPGP